MGFPIFPIFLGKVYFIYMLFNNFVFLKVIFIIISVLFNILLTFYYFILLLKSIFIDDDIKLDNSIFKLNFTNNMDIDDDVDL
jgi:formate hydrogenlyase subunit 3/multisubunit Na+/H+ antiporter MnhD subunit